SLTEYNRRDSQEKLGDVLKSEGNLAAALESYKDALAITDRMAKSEPKDFQEQRNLAIGLSHVAGMQMATGKSEEALANYTKALAVEEKLVSTIEASEVEDAGKAGPGTAIPLRDVAWMALFVRDFTKALNAADRVLVIAANDLSSEINRAHALMYLGRS